jgi:hypothetical protein
LTAVYGDSRSPSFWFSAATAGTVQQIATATEKVIEIWNRRLSFSPGYVEIRSNLPCWGVQA